ncbi:PREDICTED: cAMP-dependent protein kinase type II-beta regulatory subunit [Ficedula albicollis]|nr:PREDICTED: cAMP-dependent protein kinase type II-beta regulatory subunit [Ficedula albicollis]
MRVNDVEKSFKAVHDGEKAQQQSAMKCYMHCGPSLSGDMSAHRESPLSPARTPGRPRREKALKARVPGSPGVAGPCGGSDAMRCDLETRQESDYKCLQHAVGDVPGWHQKTFALGFWWGMALLLTYPRSFKAPAVNRFTRRASVCAEAYNPDEEEDDAESRIIHPKTDDQRNRLQEACKDILLFKNLDPEQMSQVLDAMFEKMVEGGEHVIDQGDDGDNFYVIDRGTYDIYVKCDGVGRCVGTYDNRGCFGELALMYNTPRAATIIATSPGSIWGLDRVTFRRIIVKNNAKKRRMYESFIESLPFLKSLEVSERLKVVDVIGTKVYKDGEQIIAQGDLADSFFIVESGEVRIIMTRKGKQDLEENGAVEIARCSRGQYFGELALVTNKPRAASAFALGTVKCLVMDVQAFERLLGPCMEILKRNIANYEEQLVALFGTNMDIADTTA